MAAQMPTFIDTVRKVPPRDYKNLFSIPETMLIFNLSSEPAFKYSLASFADSSSEPKGLISVVILR